MNISLNSKKVTRKDTPREFLLLEKTAGKPLAKEFVGSSVDVRAGGERPAEERRRIREVTQRWKDREAVNRGEEPEPIPDPSENLLGDVELGLESLWAKTEIEMNVQLPTCEMIEKDKTKRLSHNCTWKNVNMNHWIKVSIPKNSGRPHTNHAADCHAHLTARY